MTFDLTRALYEALADAVSKMGWVEKLATLNALKDKKPFEELPSSVQDLFSGVVDKVVRQMR